ncbi:MAG TPA: hypothetical protein VHO72_12950 [Bacteroidales bacterium]|nr:hypothetical protein [Bacteroidales bacterium]
MPLLTKPTSDAARIGLLNATVKTGKSDVSKGKKYLSDETLKQASDTANQFSNLLKAETGKLAARSKEVREKNQALIALDAALRDTWEVIKRRVFRKNEPAEVLTYYQLPLDGTVPKLISEKEIFTLADRVIAGDKKAAAAGYDAAVCPSAEELQQMLDAARKESEDVAQSDRDYDDSHKLIAPLRTKADELINDIIAELQYNLRKLDPSNARRIMRSYGITFQYAKGEPEDIPATAPSATAN